MSLARSRVTQPPPLTTGSRSLRGGVKFVWIPVAVVFATVGPLAAWILRPTPPPPPVGNDVATTARFVSTSAFEKLPESEKAPYRGALRQQTRHLAAALANGSITREQYDEAYLNGWLSKQLDHMGDFYRLPIATREQVWVAKYREKMREAKPSLEPKPSNETERHFLKRVIRTWDSDDQAKWEEFRRVAKHAKQSASGASPRSE